MENIVIITGSYPPDICGVGDYTEKLIQNLKKKMKVALCCEKNWSLTRFSYLKKKIFSKEYDIFHFQYPTMGYSWSILPQLFSLLYGKKMIVTLHEYSQRKLKAKIATYLFFLSKSHIIFTTNEEYEYAVRYAPWIKSRSTVINIGSNILFLEKNTKKIYDFGYFGLIMPNKGIEEYLEFIKKEKLQDNSYLMGKIVSGFEDFSKKIISEFSKNNIKVYIDKNEKEVSEILSDTKCMYLIYPDGVSFRRGTLLASLGNGSEVITKRNKNENVELSKLCHYIDEIDENFIKSILLSKYEMKNQKKIRDKLLKRFSWDKIAEQHKKFYNSM